MGLKWRQLARSVISSNNTEFQAILEMNLREFDTCWFALQVRPRYERLTATILRDKGYEEFVPMSRVTRQWSDRRKEIEVPLFPGYVFCRFNIAVQAPILSTAGAIRLVGNGKEPIAICNKEIEDIQVIVRSGKSTETHPYLTVGQRVRIDEGALRGMEGILVSLHKSRRLILSVNLVHSSIAVEVGDAGVSPVDDEQFIRILPAASNSRSPFIENASN